MRLEHAERLDTIGALSEVGAPGLVAGGGGNYMIDNKLTISVGDYRDIEIPEDSVIVCDIPYKDTREYRHNKDVFDHDSFYLWAEAQTVPVFICEYWMPDDGFFCIAEFDRVSTFSATNNSMRVKEKISLPNKWREWWNSKNSARQMFQKALFDDI